MLFRWNLLIVHIVPVAAIRKSILVKGIVSEPWPAGGPNPPGRGGLPADRSFYGRRIRSDSRSTDSCKRTIDVEAGGNAMRRPPEVGLVVLLLLGTSGCAGFQRLNGLPSDAPRSDGDKASSARFSWWGPQRPGAAEAPTPRRISRQRASRRLISSRPVPQGTCGQSRSRSGWLGISRVSAGCGSKIRRMAGARWMIRPAGHKRAGEHRDREMRPRRRRGLMARSTRPIRVRSTILLPPQPTPHPSPAAGASRRARRPIRL